MYNDILEKLAKSKFRSSFHLSNKDIKYINDKGLDVIRKHAEDFIKTRLAPLLFQMTANKHQCRDIPFL